MAEHFTKTTVEASVWCSVCSKATMHFIVDGRRGSCKVCLTNRETEALKPKPAPPAQQESLF